MNNVNELKVISFESSALCNLKCIMCPTLSYKDGFGIPKNGIFNELINQVDDIEIMSLEGWGEPMLNKDIFKYVYEAKSKAKKVGFTTNATLLSNFSDNEIKESKIDWLAISIDAGSKNIYEYIRQGAEFETVKKNILHFKELGVSVSFAMTIGKDNINDINNLMLLANECEVKHVMLKRIDVVSSETVNSYVADIVDVQNAISLAYDFIAENNIDVNITTFNIYDTQELSESCLANAHKSLFVNYKGDISPCCNLGHRVPQVYENKLVNNNMFKSFGNIMENNIYDIWNSEDYKEFRNLISNKIRPKECIGCRLLK